MKMRIWSEVSVYQKMSDLIFFYFLNEFAILNKKDDWKNAKATQIISIILITALIFAI